MHMAIKPFLALLVLATMAGCQLGPDQQLVGAWTANRQLSKVPTIPFPEFGDRVERGVHSTQLKLSADHTFILTGLRQIGGAWKYENGVLTLSPATGADSPQMKLLDGLFHMKVNPDFSQMKATITSAFGPFVIVLDKTA